MTRPHPRDRGALRTPHDPERISSFPDTGRIGGFEASPPGPCRSRRQNVYSATQRQSAGRRLCSEDEKAPPVRGSREAGRKSTWSRMRGTAMSHARPTVPQTRRNNTLAANFLVPREFPLSRGSGCWQMLGFNGREILTLAVLLVPVAALARQGLCRPPAHRRPGHQATFANAAAEFFNSLLRPMRAAIAAGEAKKVSLR